MLKRLLVVAAAAGLLATVVAGRERPAIDVLEPAARLDARIRLAESLDLAKLERPAQAGAQADPFASRSFGAPAAPAAGKAEAPAPAPAAPPLPFAYLGKLIEDGKLEVFLARGAESYSVSPGETIGSDYRLDAVTDNQITFTYLPLKTKQTLPL